MLNKLLRISTALVATAALVVACGGGDPTANTPGGDNNPPVERFAVSGSVSGLETGNPVTLEINGVEAVSVSADGNYSFPSTVPADTTYSVVIKKQPFWQWCTVENGSGSVAAEVNNIKVQCKAALAKVETVPGTTDSFGFTTGIVGDGKGNLWVSDSEQCNIKKISADGSISLVAGAASGDASPCGYLDADEGTAARFQNPLGLALDASGTLYVSDNGNARIRAIAPNGGVTTVAGGGDTTDDGPALGAYLGDIYQIAMDSSGNLLLASYAGDVIWKVSDLHGSPMISTIAGVWGEDYSIDGPIADARFDGPNGITADALGNIFITDYNASTLRKIDTAGMVSTFAGSGDEAFVDGTGTAASFYRAEAVTVDAVGNLYVADSHNHRIRRIDPAGVVTTLAGADEVGSQDGYGWAATFDYPNSIYIDGNGVIWVTDDGESNYGVRKITPIDPSTEIIVGTPAPTVKMQRRTMRQDVAGKKRHAR